MCSHQNILKRGFKLYSHLLLKSFDTGILKEGKEN